MAREHVHLIGIGGTGMTALAGLLHESGARVTGSDRRLYPPTSKVLEDLGLEVHSGFEPVRLSSPPDLVVIGNAVSRGNPEVEETLDRDLPYTSMPRLLSERFLRGRHSIVVAGTHGKTTTTAMLAWVLTRAGRDPGFLVGGLPGNFDRPFRLGGGRPFVIEGDEYDSAFFDKGPKFMHYRPRTAIVGTVEFDHADIFRDLEQVKSVFRHFTNLVPRRGLIVRHEDCAVTREVTSHALARVEGYGDGAGTWRIAGFNDSPGGCSFRVLRDGERYADVELRMGGSHNARNALAVIAAAAEQGLGVEEIVTGLASFDGVHRRLEVRGEVDGVTVLDDFAHHPTAIEVTLAAVRRRFPEGRVWAVLEPRSWSLRRNVFQERLPEALASADRVVVAAVFDAEKIPAGERLDPERVVADLVGRGEEARFLPDVPSIVSHLSDAVRAGDAVVIMSNGAFGGLHEDLLNALRKRAASAG